jgi:hypothetical protein
MKIVYLCSFLCLSRRGGLAFGPFCEDEASDGAREIARQREAKKAEEKRLRLCSKYLGGAWGNFGEEQEDRYERGRRLGR